MIDGGKSADCGQSDADVPDRSAQSGQRRCQAHANKKQAHQIASAEAVTQPAKRQGHGPEQHKPGRRNGNNFAIRPVKLAGDGNHSGCVYQDQHMIKKMPGIQKQGSQPIGTHGRSSNSIYIYMHR